MQAGDLVRRTYMYFPSLGTEPIIGVVLFTYDWELRHCEVISERR